MRKQLYLLVVVLWFVGQPALAVLKEKDLNSTLAILRTELSNAHYEQERKTHIQAQYSERIRNEFRNIMQKSSQNALMLYSQKTGYVFDLSYACHEATDMYNDFRQRSRPIREFIEHYQADIARYDSLIGSLERMRMLELSKQGKVDRNVCLTLAVNLRKSLLEDQEAMDDYINRYNRVEHRLKYLNDFAQKRYNEIQNNIFKNGDDSYFTILKSLNQQLMMTAEKVNDKYRPIKRARSEWDVRVILSLFVSIFIYGIVAVALNLLVFYFLPKRFRTNEFKRKRACIIMATTTITFALILAFIRAFSEQNFLIMASNLLVEYAWLLGVILISLLIRVEGHQITSAFRIYAPLVVIGFIVIAFRIILIPNALVNLIFPPILLVCAIWQWIVIRRHNKQIPRSDMFYSYISLVVFLGSVICSWIGYTLMSVQALIWWIMQLTCVLTITCLAVLMKQYGDRHRMSERPINETWFFQFVYKVVLPVLSLLSIPLSIYLAADVFNLSDLTWQVFTAVFLDMENLRLSILSIIQVVSLYFLFRYLNNIALEFLHLHFVRKNFQNTGSREVMGKNVIQVFVWGVWLMLSLTILHVGSTWLAYIAGGLSTGIGFASKDILENLYYGISLMAGRIKVGDWIECDGTKGKVSSISYTSTMIDAIDGSVIAFTNSQLFTKNYKNLTKNHGYVLSLIPFGVAYGSNMKQVCQLIEEAVTAMHHQWLDPVKPVKVVFTDFGDSSINFQLLCWVDAIKQIYAVSDVMECIYETLGKHGIEIPFPQRDIYIKSMPRKSDHDSIVNVEK